MEETYSTPDLSIRKLIPIPQIASASPLLLLYADDCCRWFQGDFSSYCRQLSEQQKTQFQSVVLIIQVHQRLQALLLRG